MSKFIDITGNKYNHLTVIERGPDLIKKNGKHDIRWWCECDCGSGKRVLVLGYNLKNGNTTSCGCEHLRNAKEQGKKNGPIQGKNNKKYNDYDLSGEYGIGYTLKGEPFYFDLEDYDLIKNYCWYINRQGYVVNKTDEELISMHRLVMGLGKDDEEYVDHIFHNTNDNRKSKLRIVNPSENAMNKGMQSNNTSGVKGVWLDKNTNKWCVEIGYYNQRIRPGGYLTLDQAAEIRKTLEEELFQEYQYKTEVINP